MIGGLKSSENGRFRGLSSAWVTASVARFLWSGGKLFGHLQVSTVDAAFNIPLVCEGSFAIAFIPSKLSHG